jgi:hypothetical protein
VKLLDTRGRLFGVINVIDFLIVVLFVTFVSGFAYTRYFRNRVLETLVPRDIQVTFMVPTVRGPSIEAVSVGDRVVESKTNGYLGEVIAVSSEPADVVTQLPDGRYYEMPSTNRKDLYVVVEGPGKVTGNAIILGSQEVRIGAKVSIKTNLYAFESIVWGIDTQP